MDKASNFKDLFSSKNMFVFITFKDVFMHKKHFSNVKM